MKQSTGVTTRRDVAVDAVAVLVLSTLAVLSFRSSYGGVEFLVLGVAGAAMGLLVALGGRRWNWPFLLSLAVGLVVYAVVGGTVALRSKATAGVLPSVDSLSASLRQIVVGWKELITTTPPVGDIGDLLALPVFGGLVAAFASLSIVQRTRHAAIAVLPPAIVLGVGIATGMPKPVSLVLHGAVFSGAAIGWLAWKEHRQRPRVQTPKADYRRATSATAVLVAASSLGLALAPSMPFSEHSKRTIWRQTVTPPFDPREYPSPLSGYRRYVKGEERKNEVMFTVEGLPEGVPVRLATMDAYDGLVWRVSVSDPNNPTLNDSGSFERVGVDIPPEFDGETTTVTVTIGKYADVWVPDVGEVISLRFSGSAGGAQRDRQLSEAFRYNRATDTAASRLRLVEGDRYVMKVRLPHLADRLTGKVIVPEVARIGSTISVTQIVEKLQSEVVAVKDTGEQLDHIVELMRKGAYSDGDQEAGQQPSRGGHSAARLSEFVTGFPQRLFIGNAEQYASTFALLFRDVGHLPTRVVMGFRPTRKSTDEPVEVLAKDVDAWVEVPVQGMGWVAVFPTPDRDNLALTSSAQQQPEPDYRTQNPPPPPLIDPDFDRPATAAGKAKSNKKTEPPQAAKPSDGSSFWSSPAVVAGAAAGLPVVAIGTGCTVIVFVKARRRRRRRRSGAPHVRIANGWREVIDMALDRGHPVPSTTTRREAAAFVGAGTTLLAQQADAAVWGMGEATEEQVDRYWADLTDALRAMKSQLGTVDRFKCAVSIRSLRLAERVPGRSRTR